MLSASQNLLSYQHISYSHIVVSLFLRQIPLFVILLSSKTVHEIISIANIAGRVWLRKGLAVSPPPFCRGTQSNVGQYQPTVQYALCLLQLQGCWWNNVAFLIHDSSLGISTEFKLYWIIFGVIQHCVHSPECLVRDLCTLPNFGDPLWR